MKHILSSIFSLIVISFWLWDAFFLQTNLLLNFVEKTWFTFRLRYSFNRVVMSPWLNKVFVGNRCFWTSKLFFNSYLIYLFNRLFFQSLIIVNISVHKGILILFKILTIMLSLFLGYRLFDLNPFLGLCWLPSDLGRLQLKVNLILIRNDLAIVNLEKIELLFGRKYVLHPRQWLVLRAPLLNNSLNINVILIKYLCMIIFQLYRHFFSHVPQFLIKS